MYLHSDRAFCVGHVLVRSSDLDLRVRREVSDFNKKGVRWYSVLKAQTHTCMRFVGRRLEFKWGTFICERAWRYDLMMPPEGPVRVRRWLKLSRRAKKRSIKVSTKVSGIRFEKRWSMPAHSTRTELVDRIENQHAAVQPKYRNSGCKHSTTTN